jgi:hypothetical protein
MLAPCAQAEVIVGLTDTNQLVTFDSAAPGTILSTVAITGLQGGEILRGIDIRPATGQLYGLGSTSRIYRINPFTGAATAVGSGPFSPLLSGTEFGFDFNPVPDAIRIVSEGGQNLRVNPNTGVLLGQDTGLVYAPGDPREGVPPDIVGAAYTNNTEGAVNTTLYAIEALGGFLVRVGGPESNPSPNTGQLFTVGALGVTTTQPVGFDIAPGTGRAFASVNGGGGPTRLNTVNLATGQATLVGSIGGGAIIRAIAVLAFQRTLVVGAGAGGGPPVMAFDAVTGTLKFNAFPFPPGFTGGVRVATCDVNGDGVPDIVAGAGPGGGPHVRVFHGVTGADLPGPIGSFFPFAPAFTGGVFVGCLDLNYDGKADVVVGAGAGGGPHVRVFDGATGLDITGTPLGSFFPFPPAFTGGVFVGGH